MLAASPSTRAAPLTASTPRSTSSSRKTTASSGVTRETDVVAGIRTRYDARRVERDLPGQAWCTVTALSQKDRGAPMRPLCRAWGGAISGPFVLATIVSMLTLSGCSSDDDGASDEPLFGADMPKVGACRVLTAADIEPASNDTPTVSCSSAHTSVTIAVGGFPAARVTNANLTNGTLGNEALQRCTAAWRSTVGGDLSAQHTTILGLAYYLPNQDQLSRGARWYRCDVVMGGQDGMALQDLPRNVEGLLDGDVPDSLVACRTAPDFKEGHEVACSSRHVLRAVGVASLPDQPQYPGASVLRTASEKGCQPVVRSWLHGRFAGGAAYQWPDRTSWRLLEDRSATCWAVTTN
jgi:hypothetical protein